MAKKKDASTGSADASFLRRSGRETSSRKQTTSSPVNSRKSERIEKHTSPSPSPVKNKLEKIEKQMGPSPLRRSDRGKKSVEITEKQDPDVGGRKRKTLDAVRYKALFKSQRRTRTESDVDKELKSQNSVSVQGAPDKECKAVLEGRVTDLDQIGHGDCPQTKSLDGKSIESGDVEKINGGNISPSNGNIANSDNYMLHTSSSHRIEHDLENQQEPDTRHKVTETRKPAGIIENEENNDASSSMQNSKFVEFWVPVHISNVQLEQYCATLLSNAMALRSSSKSDTLGALDNTFFTNRMCCNHPYTVDRKIEDSLIKDKGQSMIVDVGKEVSGKFQFLDHILPEIRKRQLRVLILFQPTIGALRSGFLPLGRILSDFIHRRFGDDSYEHVDGLPNIAKKQAAINMFNKDRTRFIFLIESRTCHQSIKLSSVDAIIIFDSELNPSNDLKSLQKLSIDSPLDQIMIFRLYCSSTLEEKILKLAENNVTVDIRSHTLRSNYDPLLMWGASDLFDKLTKFHSQTVLNISSEESFLKDVVEEFLYILSHKCKSNDTTLKLISTRILNCGIYGKNTLLHSEVKTQLPDGDQPPYMFWRKLLDGRSPDWKFVSESTPRRRKRPNYFLDSPPQGDVDGGGVKTRRKTVNINSTVEPARFKTVTEGETGGVNEVNDESQSSSGDRFWSTTVNNETSLLDQLKPTVSELCNILKFSEDVKVIVGKLLEFVLDNYKVSKEHTSTLQGLMISLCWISSSLAKNKIDRSESLALARKHFNFSCEEKEVESVYEKLKQVKRPFLEHTKILPLKDSAPAPEGVKLGIEKSEHITNVDASNENVSRKGGDVVEKIIREWDEKRASLEHGYKVDKAIILALYSNSSKRSGKLEILERKFANELKENERLFEISLKDLKVTMLAAEGPVVADNAFSLRGSHDEIQVVQTGNPEVAPTLPEKPIEAQSDDEPVCEGVNDIESTGSHISEKEMVDAAVSSEQIGEVPAQQLGNDMEVDVAEKVDSGHENAKASHAVEDHNETGANDMPPHVNCGDVEMPAGNYNKENDEDDTVGLDISHVVENRHETVDDVAPEVESTEMGTPLPAGTRDRESPEDGEILPDAGDDHNETSPNNVLPRAESAEMATPADDEENAEDSIIRHDVLHANEDHNVSCGSNNSNPACAAISQDKTPSVRLVSSPASDHEIQNEPLQLEQIPDNRVQDEEINVGNLQPSGASQPDQIIPDDESVMSQDKTPFIQPVSSPASIHEIQNDPLQLEQLPDSGVQDEEINVDQIIPDDEPGSRSSTDPTVAENPSDMLPPSGSLLRLPDSGVQDEEINVDQIILDDEPDVPLSTDPMVVENPSDTLPPTGPLLEPVCEEPTLTVPRSGENLEENPVPASETRHEEHQPNLATSVAPTPLVNALNMFDNVPNRVIPQMPNQTDPLQAEVERLYIVKDNVAKYYEDMKQNLNSECEKEIVEVVAQISLKYEARRQQADAAYKSKKMELETNIDRVKMNRILAEAFRSKCQDLTPSGNPGMQQVSQAVQQLRRLSNPPSTRLYHGASTSSPGQSSGNQQPPPPPPPPLQQPQLRPQPPLQIVHQPAALFSSPLSRPASITPNRPPSNTSSSTTPTRPPPVVNQITSSTPPTTSRQLPTRPSPIVSPVVTPSTTPTTSRPPPGFNTNSLSFLHNRPPSIAQRDMSAANLRISTETRGQSSHVRPPGINETRAPAPHLRPPVISETRAPAPHVRPPVISETRAPAPHVRPPVISETRAPAPHVRPPVISETRAPAPHVRPPVISETRAPASHVRPLVISETRSPAPHLRPLVISETRAPAPHLRPLVISETRAPAPHLRSLASTEIRARAPHMQPFRPTRSVSPDVGTHQRMSPSQHVTGGPSQSPVMPPMPPMPTFPSQPPPSAPYTVPSSPPLLPTDLGSHDDMLDIADIMGEGNTHPSSAHDLVCLSDDD